METLHDSLLEEPEEFNDSLDNFNTKSYIFCVNEKDIGVYSDEKEVRWFENLKVVLSKIPSLSFLCKQLLQTPIYIADATMYNWKEYGEDGTFDILGFYTKRMHIDFEQFSDYYNYNGSAIVIKAQLKEDEFYMTLIHELFHAYMMNGPFDETSIKMQSFIEEAMANLGTLYAAREIGTKLLDEGKNLFDSVHEFIFKCQSGGYQYALELWNGKVDISYCDLWAISKTNEDDIKSFEQKVKNIINANK